MTALGIEQSAVPKVPVWRVVKAAYRDTFGNIGGFATAAAVPFILSLLLDIALPEQEKGIGLNILRIVVSTVFVALFEVVWLRHLLLERASGRPGLFPSLNRRLRLFTGYALLLSLLFLPALFFQKVLVETALTSPVFFGAFMIVLYVITSYLSVRFAFVYLWIALDAPERLGESWRRTRKNGLRILIAVALVALPMVLIPFAFGVGLAIVDPDLATQFETGTFEGGTRWFVLVAGNALLFLYYALSCAVLVGAFCALTGWQPDRRELLERFE